MAQIEPNRSLELRKVGVRDLGMRPHPKERKLSLASRSRRNGWRDFCSSTQQHMDIIDSTLIEDARALCRSPVFRDAVWRLCPDHVVGAHAGPPSMHIHPNDQMLRHSLRGW